MGRHIFILHLCKDADDVLLPATGCGDEWCFIAVAGTPKNVSSDMQHNTYAIIWQVMNILRPKQASTRLQSSWRLSAAQHLLRGPSSRSRNAQNGPNAVTFALQRMLAFLHTAADEGESLMFLL